MIIWVCRRGVNQMKVKRKRKDPEIVMRGGKPTAVILSIEEYRKLLERVEDAEDLKTLRAMRKRPLRFRKLDDFLNDSAGVCACTALPSTSGKTAKWSPKTVSDFL